MFQARQGCRSFPCQNGGTCIEPSQGTFICNCPEGWIGAECKTGIEDDTMVTYFTLECDEMQS